MCFNKVMRVGKCLSSSSTTVSQWKRLTASTESLRTESCLSEERAFISAFTFRDTSTRIGLDIGVALSMVDTRDV